MRSPQMSTSDRPVFEYCWRSLMFLSPSVTSTSPTPPTAPARILGLGFQTFEVSRGDVVSVELLEGKRKVFSFQIAHRSAQLQPSVPLPWANSLLDSFDDLVARKMVALIERGAPRTFEIFTRSAMPD